MPRSCIICRKVLRGRSDKRFCSLDCKNNYHVRLRRNTRDAVLTVDRILHRNRSILLELVGRNKAKKISRLHLDHLKFNFDFYTGSHLNTREKMIYHVYDFSWAIFSDQEVLITRNKLISMAPA